MSQEGLGAGRWASEQGDELQGREVGFGADSLLEAI